LRALAVTSATPWTSVPTIPTVAATLPGFEVRSWLGVAAPAGTPASIVQKLNAEVHKALKQPDLQKSFAAAGSAVAPNSPEEMRIMVSQEIARWRSVVARANIPLQDG